MVKSLVKAREIQAKYCTSENVKMFDEYNIDGYYFTDAEVEAIIQELKDAGYEPYVNDLKFEDAPDRNRKDIHIKHSYFGICAYKREVA